MLNIVTVQVGNYCGRGAEYVRRLFEGFEKHLGDTECKFWCLTDDPLSLPLGVEPIEAEPNTTGWWNKISLFKPGLLPKGRILFSDLDAIPTGDLTDIANYRGKFAAVRDFYNQLRLQSCLMAWEAGTLDHIWQMWNRAGRPQFDPRGDQAFIEGMHGECDYFQDLFPGQLASYKIIRRLGGVPPGVRLVCFHGVPRPHEVNFELPTPS